MYEEYSFILRLAHRVHLLMLKNVPTHMHGLFVIPFIIFMDKRTKLKSPSIISFASSVPQWTIFNRAAAMFFKMNSWLEIDYQCNIRVCFSYQFFKDALMSLKENRVGLLRLKKKQSWNMIKQMKRMLARHQGKKQNFREKLGPILEKLTESVQKVTAAINRSMEESNSELTSRTTETGKLKDELKNLQDEIAKMTQEIKDYEQSISKLKNDKESKEKAKDVLSAEIQKRKTCVKKRQDGRSSGKCGNDLLHLFSLTWKGL